MENTTAMQKREAGALNSAQISIVTQKTPQELIKLRKGKGGKVFSYVPHNYVTRILNDAFCHAWSFKSEPIPPLCSDDEIVVKGILIIHTPAGEIVKEQYGAQEIPIDSKTGKPGMTKGDALKGAGSDALRKCASLLGIALDLYGEEFPEMPAADEQDRQPAQPKRQAERPRDASQARAELETVIKQLRDNREMVGEKQSAYVYFTRKLFECGQDLEKLEQLDSDIYYFRSKGELRKAA